MPHVSADAEGSEAMVDYSSFEYQTVNVQVNLREADGNTGGTNPTASAAFEIEPLGAIGGLDNNEVAELVYLETQVFLEHEDATADQNVGTSTECRGHVGINLPDSQSAFIDVNSQATGNVDAELIRNDDIASANVAVAGFENADDEYLQHFKAIGGPPFDDQSTGVGGSNFTTQFYAEKNYRELTNRGPVLDSNDDIVILERVAAEDIVIDVIGDVRVHMVWDVAETDDAGRAFGIPR